MKLIQRKWVEQILVKTGKISRNHCLQNYVSRLGAIILNLKDDGWEFDAKYVEYKTLMGWSGRDYVYEVKKYPKEIQEKIDEQNSNE